MRKENIKTIHGVQYIEIESVRFEGKVYKRFIGADYMNPEVLLFDETGNQLPKDSELYVRIREKFALDKDFFNGDLRIPLTFDGFKKFVSYVVLAAGVSSWSYVGLNIINSFGTAEKDKPNISIALKSDSVKAWKKELSLIPSFKDVKVRDIDKGSKKISGDDTGLPIAKEIEFKQIDSVIESEKDNGKLLSSLYCAGILCYREYSDYFIEKAQEDLNEMFFESDKKEFSERAANDEVLSSIAKKRGIDNVEQWYKKRMENVKKYVYKPYDVNNKMAYFDPYDKVIGFTSFSFAMDKNTRAHEMSHAISNEAIDSNTERTGFHISKKFRSGMKTKFDERGRAINEGVTNLMAKKLSGEKSKYTTYSDETSIATLLAIKYSEEVLFDSYLHDVNIIGDKINEDRKDPTAFTKFVSNLDEYKRLNEKVNERNLSASERTEIKKLRDEKLKEAEYMFGRKSIEELNNEALEIIKAINERELI